MKNTIIKLAFLIALVSCSKEPAVQQSNDNNADIQFTATTESYCCDTKTNLSESYILWKVDDRIEVLDAAGNEGQFKATIAGSTTSFEICSIVNPTTSPYYAVYPADKCKSMIAGTFVIQYNSTQNYTIDSFESGSFPMVAYTTGTNFSFKNVGGILLVNLKTSNTNINVKSLEISADQDLYGKATVTYDGVTNPAITTLTEGGNTLTVNFATPISISSTATPIYVSVPGNDYTNVRVKVITDNDIEQTLTAASVGVVRSKKTTLNAGANKLYRDVALLNSTQVGYSTRQNGNCYIINDAGSYKLPLIEGVTSNVLDADDVSIVWQQNDILNDVSTDGDYLQFNTVADMPQGNALVAAKKNGDIIWSWHIWSTNFQIGVDEKTLDGGSWIDRNLGAYILDTATINGLLSDYYISELYYTCKRKDPVRRGTSVTFERPDSATAVKNPDKFYSTKAATSWTSELSKFSWSSQNPCPVGYTIAGTWTVFTFSNYCAGGMCWRAPVSYLDGWSSSGYSSADDCKYWKGDEKWYFYAKKSGNKKTDSAAENIYANVRCVKRTDIN